MDLDFVQAFDSDAHATFSEGGMGAASGSYLPAGASEPLAEPVRAYVEHAAGALGDFRQVQIDQVTVRYLLADCAPGAGDRFTVGAETWENIDQIENDGSLASWAVRRV